MLGEKGISIREVDQALPSVVDAKNGVRKVCEVPEVIQMVKVSCPTRKFVDLLDGYNVRLQMVSRLAILRRLDRIFRAVVNPWIGINPRPWAILKVTSLIRCIATRCPPILAEKSKTSDPSKMLPNSDPAASNATCLHTTARRLLHFDQSEHQLT